MIKGTELNKEQYAAVNDTEGPLLILAAAGTGKTKTLVSRVVHLIDIGVPPEKILLLTFTNKAADEMKSRAVASLDNRCDGITACTYHSFCASMLRIYHKAAGLDANYSIMTPGEVSDAISFLKTESGLSTYRNFPRSSMAAAIISASINKNVPIREILKEDKYKKYELYEEELNQLADDYIAYKAKRGLLDYDDLLLKFYEMLVAHPRVAKKISDAYEYIMVDEYQDTNILQEMIIEQLRTECRKIAVVGDDAQSIYGFRGSNVENILDFPNKYPDCKTVTLVENYRSCQEVLDFANDVMRNHDREGIYKEMTGQYESGQKPYAVYVPGEYEEAAFIRDTILEKHKNGVPFSSFAILCRSSRQSMIFESLLGQADVSYDKYGGQKFLEKAHVLDILAYLKIIVNPYDELAYFRILKLYNGIGERYAHKISKDVPGKGQTALTDNEFKKRCFYPSLVKLNELIDNWRDLDFKMMMTEIVAHWNAVRKETINTMATDEDTKSALHEELTERAMDLEVLKQIAGEYETPVKFMDAIVLDSVRDDSDDTDRVVISTIHSAKGLEFDTVFVLNCVMGVFPSIQDWDIGTHADMEELRCFYVAITRARKELFIMLPEVVNLFGRTINGEPAYYLEGAEAHMTEISI